MAAQSLIRHNWLLRLCLEEGRQPDVFPGTAGDDWCHYCTSSVKNIRDPRLILYLVFCPFSSSLQLPELQEGSKARRIWQLSRSKSIDRHVSHNSAITIHCSSLEHVDNMNSWCQIPSIAPDGCDAIDLAELGRPNTAIITTRDLNLDRVNDCKKEKWGGGNLSGKFLSHVGSLKSHPPIFSTPRSHLDSALHGPPSMHCLHVTAQISHC